MPDCQSENGRFLVLLHKPEFLNGRQNFQIVPVHTFLPARFHFTNDTVAGRQAGRQAQMLTMKFVP